MNRPLLSICIPSYNRPQQIVDLLKSIDCDPAKVEIVICEDKSPQREQIGAAVELFANGSKYQLHFFENEKNFGFDGNLRRLVERATGKFVMFMGDDDWFVPLALDKFLNFLIEHKDIKYILRSYLTVHSDGHTENFRYLPCMTTLPSGEATVAWLFKRSVTISGFTISRDDALSFSTDELDGTLLYQVYLMAQICLKNESIYYDVPFVQTAQSFREDKPNFGAAEAEKSRYTPGTVSHDNSINFTKAYFELTAYLDKQHGTHLTPLVLNNLSKYSYPFLSIQRKRGISSFLRYAKRLETEAGFGCTVYFFIYKWALVLFGENICDRIIARIKQGVGYAPNF
ncbi:MAG: glycosyltransferase family 2 protein [Methylococcaceae bacterium]